MSEVHGPKPLQLWSAGDIGKMLGVDTVTVKRWVWDKKWYDMPDPAAVTQAGHQYWTEDQVKAICKIFYEKAPSKQLALAQARQQQRQST